MLYLAQNLEVEDWRAVVFYPRRNLEQKNLYRHRNLLNSDQFQTIYLEDFLGVPSDELGIQLMQLIVSPERETNRYLSGLVEQLQGKTEPKDQAIIKLVSTIMLYKFPNLTREEIESMFTVSDLKQTRVYKDAVQEGIQQGLIQGLEQGLMKGLAKGRDEGREEGREQALERERSLIKRMLIRKLGELPTDLDESVQTLSFEQLADLGEALFDFEQPADLATWLTENMASIETEDSDRPQ
jgi:predicted transposase YdaD